MEKEIQPPQQEPVQVRSVLEKNRIQVIAGVLFIIVAVSLAGFVVLNQGKTGLPFLVAPSTKNQTEHEALGSGLSKKIVGPLTIQSLMPVVTADQPSALYENSVVRAQLSAISTTTQAHLVEVIENTDSEIKSRSVQNPQYLFKIVYTNNDQSFVLYMMTPTGTYCGDGDSDCENAQLKILNAQDNSIHLVTNNLNNGNSAIYLNQNDNSIIVFTGLQYEIFSATKPYALRRSTPVGFSSLLFNEFAVSYNQKTFNLVIEDTLNNKKIDCTIANTAIQDAFKNHFDISHFSLSPNGSKVILFEGNSKFFWDDITSQWTTLSPVCFSSSHGVVFSGVQPTSVMGAWYGDANYFAYSGYGENSFVYDFQAQKQILSLSWDKAVAVGYLNNSGYHDTTTVDEKNSKVVVVPSEKQISVYFEMSDGMRYLIGSYSDVSSTQRFSELTKQYPVNSGGDYTSGKFAGVAGPRVWALVERDSTNQNLYHLLILDWYNIRHVLEVSVQP